MTKQIARIGGGVVIAVIAAVVLAVLRGVLGGDNETAEAHQGDCIADLPQVEAGQQVEANNAKVVDCTSADARYSVVGRVDGVTAKQTSGENSTVCAPYIDAGAETIYYAISAGGKGYALCLKPA